jgi:hypothetical protein
MSNESRTMTAQQEISLQWLKALFCVLLKLSGNSSSALKCDLLENVKCQKNTMFSQSQKRHLF